MEILLQQLQSMRPLSQGALSFLESHLKLKILPRGHFILKDGQVSRMISFVETGLLRCYHKQDGNEINNWFIKEGDLCISIVSFYQQAPSYECIQALEDSRLWHMNHDELHELYHRYPEFNYHGRILTEKYHLLGEQNRIPLRFKKVPERYAFFQKNFPELVERVPAMHLASYLGTTGETLSRIKNR